jgi:hypothetical protein
MAAHRAILVVSAAALVAPVGAALAQPDPNEIMSMYVKLIDNGNANGVVEPGEIVRITVGVSFDPKKGEPMIWQSNTPLGNWPGTVEAFGQARFGLYGGPDAETGQLDFVGMAPLEWTQQYSYTKGSIWNIFLYQAGWFPTLTYDKPLDLMWWDWIPDDYTPRYVDWFSDAPGFGTHGILLSTTLPSGQNVIVGDKWLTQASPLVGIQIVPSPPALAPLILGVACLLHRRRRTDAPL